MARIISTPYYSKRIGGLARGCELCVQGRKLVLFITGLCGRKCWYCPLSEQKKQKDVTYANEWPTSKLSDIIKEAELCEAKGAGITGGDPFLRVGRAVRVIKALKKRFGPGFHIHLYAILESITDKKLNAFCSAGLDEIRFHPDIVSDAAWHKIRLAEKYSWDIGIEIPIVPGLGRQTWRLIDFFSKHVDFINLNELEICETNSAELLRRGLRPKSRLSSGVSGSEALANKLLIYCIKKGIRAHYCTTTLKDKVQMARRIKLRAKNVKEKFDCVDSDGMLVRGAIYLPSLAPGVGYRKMLAQLNSSKSVATALQKARRRVICKLQIPGNIVKVDGKKLRLVTAAGIVARFSGQLKALGLVPTVVREYPTYDALEMSIDFL